MKKVLVGIVFLFSVLAGCSTQSESKQQQTPKLVEVSLKTIPEKINPKEAVKIEALVTQGKDQVDDASEVKFELWRAGQKKHEMLTSKNEGKGIYSITKTFSEDGEYNVTAHVTARDMHVMPTKELTVGHVTQVHAENTADHSGDQHHDSAISITLNQEKAFHINENTNLLATVMDGNKPLANASVTFELWEGNDKKHTWIDAKEMGHGNYSGSTKFTKQGTFHMQIHVMKHELHDHDIVMFTVK